MNQSEWYNWCNGNENILKMINDIQVYTPYSDNDIIDAVLKVQNLGVDLSLLEIVSFIWANETPFIVLR